MIKSDLFLEYFFFHIVWAMSARETLGQIFFQ